MKYPTLLAKIRAEQMNPGCLQSGRRWPPSENKSKTKSPDSDQLVNNFFIWGKPITKSTQMNQRLITNNSVQQLNNRAMIKVLINKSSRQMSTPNLPKQTTKLKTLIRTETKTRSRCLKIAQPRGAKVGSQLGSQIPDPRDTTISSSHTSPQYSG